MTAAAARPENSVRLALLVAQLLFDILLETFFALTLALGHNFRSKLVELYRKALLVCLLLALEPGSSVNDKCTTKNKKENSHIGRGKSSVLSPDVVPAPCVRAA